MLNIIPFSVPGSGGRRALPTILVECAVKRKKLGLKDEAF